MSQAEVGVDIEAKAIDEGICLDCGPAVGGNAEAGGAGGKCVRCPFCKQTVNAILTPTHIQCPACKTSVELAKPGYVPEITVPATPLNTIT